MKKNMIWIILGTVVVVVLAIVVIMLLMGVFKKPEPIPFTETGKDFVVIGENGSDIGKAEGESKINFVYKDEESIKDKIEKVAKEVYGAEGVDYTENALQEIEQIEKLGFLTE